MTKKKKITEMLKKKLYMVVNSLLEVLGTIMITILYAINMSAIYDGYTQTEGIFEVVILILIRIFLLAGMTWVMFRKWYKQEDHYFADLPFLFGLFFFFLIFGKFLDLLFDLTFFTLEKDMVLFLLKIRFFVVILTLFPMIYLSIGMFLYNLSLKEKHEKLRVEKHRDKVRIRIIILIVLIEMIAVIMAPNTTIIGILLPVFVIPSLIIIVWLFQFAYRNKRLSQVNPLILTFGFSAYLVSQIIRPLLQHLVASAALYIILAELIDLIIFIIIFIGFYIKANYESD